MKPLLTKENYLWLRKAGYSKEEIREAAGISGSTLYLRRSDWHISTAETEAKAVSEYQPKSSDIPVWVSGLHHSRKQNLEEEAKLQQVPSVESVSNTQAAAPKEKSWLDNVRWVQAPAGVVMEPYIRRSAKGLRFNSGAMRLMNTKSRYVHVGVFGSRLIIKPTTDESWSLCRENKNKAGIIRGNAINELLDQINFPERVRVKWYSEDGVLVAEY